MTRARTLLCLLLLLGSSSLSWAQGSIPSGAIEIIDSQGRPRAGATVTFCTSAGTCTPLASIFTDAGLTTPAANPMTTDGLGNLPTIYAAPGIYKYTVTGTGIVPSGPFTANVGVGDMTLAGTQTVTGLRRSHSKS